MNALFACPVCERPSRISLSSVATSWQCPGCEHRLEIGPAEGRLSRCAVCGNAELYKKKDFPHWFGLTILTGAGLGFLLLQAFYRQWWAWVILIGSAAIDGLLYLWVGDAVVCYRCGAIHRGFVPDTEHQPFELIIGERYRQERLRREELRK